MNYGHTIRSIRKGKGLKLKEVAGTTISPSQLSRFENGLSMIPIDSFHEILLSLNTTPQEFLYILGDPQEDELQAFFSEVEQHVNKGDYAHLIKMHKELKQKQTTPYSWRRFMLLFVESLIVIDEKKKPQEQPEVMNYLMQVDDWGEMELRIYSIFGFVLDVDTTYYLMKNAVKKSQKYQSLPQDMRLLFSILSNNFSTFIYHHRFDYAQETLRIFEQQLEKDVSLLDPHLDLLFNKGIWYFTQNQEEEAKENCERVLELCRLFKQPTQEKRYHSRYKNWLNGYQNPDFEEITINIGYL